MTDPSITTVCARDCYDTCSLKVTVDETGRLIAVKGDPDHPVTRGISCPRCAGDPERVYTNRVQTPMLKRGGTFSAITWEEALSLEASKVRSVLETHGPEALLYLAYAGNSGLLTEGFPQRLWFALGATQTDWALCCRSGHKGIGLHYGTSRSVLPEDFLETELVVFWGFNPAVSAPHLWHLALEARKGRGTRIVVVDPVRSRTAAAADLWLQPRPGCDVALAFGIIREIIVRGHADREFINRHTLGFDTLADECEAWSLERVGSMTGIDTEVIQQLASLYTRHRAGLTAIGFGLQKQDNGADQARAVSLIPGVLGNPRGFFYSNQHSFYVDRGSISGETLAEKKWKTVQQVALPKLLERGDFRFIHISGTNPAMTLPDQGAFRKGLERSDLFVTVHDTHWTETAALADLVLPAPTFYEKTDLVIPWGHPWVALSPRLIAPVTQSLTEIELMQSLAGKIGVSESWVYDDPWCVIETAFSGALEEGDVSMLRTGKRLRLKIRPPASYETPSGKLEFSSGKAQRAGFMPLPVQTVPEDSGDGFTLISSATPKYTSTQFQEVYGDNRAIILMNSGDAHSLGIKAGDVVLVASDLGTVRVQADISDHMLSGVIWVPRQSKDLDGQPLNLLMNAIPQTIGGGPRFNTTRVRVRACQADDRTTDV